MKNLKRLGKQHAWLLIGIAWAGTFVLGLIGFASQTPRPRLTDAVYSTLQLISMEWNAPESGYVPPSLEIARFVFPTLAAYTLLFALFSFFLDRWRQIQLGTWHEHVVICGLSRKGWLLAQRLAKPGTHVAVIEADSSHDLIPPCRARGIVVVVGSATDPEVLARAGVLRADRLIAVTDDDGVNAETAVRCQQLISEMGRKVQSALTCTVHVVDPELYELVRTRELARKEDIPFRTEFFNVFERGAQMLWNKYGPHEQAGAPSPACSFHIVVIGLGRLGESLAVTAARDWYGRLHDSPCRADGRLRVTVVDRDAERKCQALRLRYPRLETVCDLAPWTMDVEWPEFYAGAFLDRVRSSTGDVATTFPLPSAVFVCFDDDSLGLRTGLTLRQQLLRRSATGTPVIVRTVEAGGLAQLVDPGGDDAAFANLNAFPLLDSTCTPDAILGGTYEVLARGLHEVYLQQQRGAGLDASSNPALVAWEALPAGLRESNRAEAAGLVGILLELGYAVIPLTDWDAVFFRFPESDVLQVAEREHERFLRERATREWTYTAGRKNIGRRASSTLVPWSALDESERRKACEMARRLPATLAKAGFQVLPTASHPDYRAGRPDERESIARAIHERYRLNQARIKSPDDPAMQSWDALPEDLRASNRQQADGIEATLAAIGCGVRPASDGASGLCKFTAEEVEVMAAGVHERWMAERAYAGWISSPERDIASSATPYLIPYGELSEETKELDRQAARAIPEVLAAAGLEVYRLA